MQQLVQNQMQLKLYYYFFPFLFLSINLKLREKMQHPVWILECSEDGRFWSLFQAFFHHFYVCLGVVDCEFNKGNSNFKLWVNCSRSMKLGWLEFFIFFNIFLQQMICLVGQKRKESVIYFHINAACSGNQ